MPLKNRTDTRLTGHSDFSSFTRPTRTKTSDVTEPPITRASTAVTQPSDPTKPFVTTGSGAVTEAVKEPVQVQNEGNPEQPEEPVINRVITRANPSTEENDRRAFNSNDVRRIPA